MILTCQRCGGLYGSSYRDRIAGTPCKCGWPREKMPERPEVSSSAWVDALTTALGYWSMNADKNSASNKKLEERHDYEGQVYRRCKAVLTQASTARTEAPRE